MREARLAGDAGLTARRRRRPPSAAVAVGPRLLLRPPRAGDGRELTRLNRESARLHRGRVRPPRGRAEFARYLARSRRSDTVCLLICRRADGAIAGAITIGEIVRGAGDHNSRNRREASRSSALPATIAPPTDTAKRASTAAASTPPSRPPIGSRFQQSA